MPDNWPRQEVVWNTVWKTSDGRAWSTLDEARFQQQLIEDASFYKEYWNDPLKVGSKSVGPDRLASWIRNHPKWVRQAMNEEVLF